MKKQQGFTLIELMIVVAIIGILAAIAIPQYKDYIIRSRLGKVAAAVSPIKAALSDYAQFNGGSLASLKASDWTDAMTAGGLGMSGSPTTTQEIKSYSMTTAGVITVTLQNIGTCADTNHISWTPSIGTTAVTWTVTSADFSASTVCAKEISKWR